MSKNYLEQAEDRVIDTGWGNYQLEPQTFEDLQTLQAEALKDDVDIKVCSTFRSFDRQLEIWNMKARGEKPLYDKQGQRVPLAVFDQMRPHEKVNLITTWFAVPGLSRHHFGTDFDFYDRATLERQGRTLQLIPWEYEHPAGPCARAYQWLQARACAEDFPFFWPFTAGACGVSPEPWHLSHKKASSAILEQFNRHEFEHCILAADIELKEGIVSQLDKIITHHGFPLSS